MNGPVDPGEDATVGARPGVVQYLSGQDGSLAGATIAASAHGALAITKGGPNAVSAVAVAVLDGLTDKRGSDDLPADEIRMFQIKTGVENRNTHSGPGRLRRMGASGLESPRELGR